MNQWTTRGAAVLATGILAASLTACGGSDTEGKADGKAEDTKTTALKQQALGAPGDKEQLTTQAAGNIGPGAKGYRVKCVQWGVNPYIPAKLRLAVDGDYGTKTYKAVKYYQGKRGLSADGIVGPNTGKRIKKDIRVTYDSLRRDREYAAAKPYGDWLTNCSKHLPS